MNESCGFYHWVIAMSSELHEVLHKEVLVNGSCSLYEVGEAFATRFRLVTVIYIFNFVCGTRSCVSKQNPQKHSRTCIQQKAIYTYTLHTISKQ